MDGRTVLWPRVSLVENSPGSVLLVTLPPTAPPGTPEDASLDAGGCSACSITVSAKLMSAWRILGTSGGEKFRSWCGR